MPTRNVIAACWLGASLSGCQLLNQKPAEAPPEKVVLAPSEPAPLPPEETPPPESTTPAPAPEARPVEPGITPTGGTPARGTLPKAVIDAKLKEVGPALQACYERGLKAKPELRGNVSIDFVVAPDGKIARAGASDTDDALRDPPTVECMLTEIRKLEFPPPQGGRVFINYPVHLEPPKPGH